MSFFQYHDKKVPYLTSYYDKLFPDCHNYFDLRGTETQYFIIILFATQNKLQAKFNDNIQLIKIKLISKSK